jgi:hypothetical protein
MVSLAPVAAAFHPVAAGPLAAAPKRAACRHRSNAACNSPQAAAPLQTGRVAADNPRYDRQTLELAS